MSKPKQFDDSVRHNETMGRIFKLRPGYLEGDVLTPHGIVSAYSGPGFSYLDFVWNGRFYRRTILRAYTAKGLARKARQFADEVVQERGL